MDLSALPAWLEASALAKAIRNSLYLFALIESFHVVGVSIVVGTVLVVDLRLGGAQGSAVLKPREHTVWPVRIAFRVLPGQFGVLEVHAAQRAVLPVTTSGGTKPVDLELAPGVFIMKSPQMAVSWGPADQSSGT